MWNITLLFFVEKWNAYNVLCKVENDNTVLNVSFQKLFILILNFILHLYKYYIIFKYFYYFPTKQYTRMLYLCIANYVSPQ